jgi:hypothetical protein
MKSWAFGAVVLSTVAVAACSSSGTTSGSGGSGGSGGGAGVTTSGSNTTGSNTTASTTTGSNTTGSNTTTASSTTSTGPAVDTCADATDCTACVAPSATDNTCVMCCDTATPGGLAAYNKAVLNACVCTAGATCAAACGTGAMPDLCTDMTATPSAACGTCLNGIMNTDPCVQAFSTACGADAACKGFATCFPGCAG